MKPHSLLCSQEPATGPLAEPVKSHPYHIILKSIVILSSHLYSRLPCGLFHSSFPMKTMYNWSLPCVPNATLISTLFIVEVCRSHTQLGTHIHPIGFLLTLDKPVAEVASYTTCYKHEVNICALSRIWTHDPSNQAAADLCLRPHVH